MTEPCTHPQLVDGYYGQDCAVCGVLVYPHGQEPWNVPTDDEQARIDAEEYRATHWTCETCGGENGDGWTTCRCDEPLCCEHCGEELDYEECDQCEDGYSGHDCGEDCCACLEPELNERREQCDGKGGWHWCRNKECPGKHTP